jgi:hypothetical protein
MRQRASKKIGTATSRTDIGPSQSTAPSPTVATYLFGGIDAAMTLHGVTRSNNPAWQRRCRVLLVITPLMDAAAFAMKKMGSAPFPDTLIKSADEVEQAP